MAGKGKPGPRNVWERWGAQGGAERAKRHTHEELSAMSRNSGRPRRVRLADLEGKEEGAAK